MLILIRYCRLLGFWHRSLFTSNFFCLAPSITHAYSFLRPLSHLPDVTTTRNHERTNILINSFRIKMQRFLPPFLSVLSIIVSWFFENSRQRERHRSQERGPLFFLSGLKIHSYARCYCAAFKHAAETQRTMKKQNSRDSFEVRPRDCQSGLS